MNCIARWLQLGVFTPLMRSHSVINEKNKEPWEYGDAFTAINRASIQLRYRMLPYIYNVMAEASATGMPAMRPLILEYPADGRFTTGILQLPLRARHARGTGASLMTAREREVRFPEGTWYDFWTGKPYRRRDEPERSQRRSNASRSSCAKVPSFRPNR